MDTKRAMEAFFVGLRGTSPPPPNGGLRVSSSWRGTAWCDVALVLRGVPFAVQEPVLIWSIPTITVKHVIRGLPHYGNWVQ